MIPVMDTTILPTGAPPESISIRRMRLDDLEQVHEIDRVSFALPWPANSFKYEMEKNPSSLLWVAEATRTDGSRCVAGSIVVWMVLDEAHIATIAVLPGYRGRGISRELMAAGLLDALDHGAVSATLEVRAGNRVAIGLYEKFKFVEAGIRPRYYRDNNEDALILTVADTGPAYRAWLESRAWDDKTGDAR